MFDTIIYGNSVRTWLLAGGTAALCIALLPLIKRILIRRLRRLAAKTSTDVDDMMVEVIRGTKGFTFVLVGVVTGASLLDLSPGIQQALRQGIMIVLFLQGTLWGNAAISFYQQKRTGAAGTGQDPATAAAFRVLTRAARVALWAVAGLLVLDNLGVNVTGLVAGLGIGGLAVALALQNILGDLFASLTILLDKPFVVGDFVVVDSVLGSVEHIGLKTTRLRSLSGEQIIVSNADLLGSRIRNYKRMQERRVVLSLDVTYQTSASSLALGTRIVRECIQAQPRTRFDRAHFKEFAASALRLEAVYYILDPDYNTFMDIQQEVNLTILRRFASEGIEFAYPTTTVMLQDPAGPPSSSRESLQSPPLRGGADPGMSASHTEQEDTP